MQDMYSVLTTPLEDFLQTVDNSLKGMAIDFKMEILRPESSLTG